MENYYYASTHHHHHHHRQRGGGGGVKLKTPPSPSFEHVLQLWNAVSKNLSKEEPNDTWSETLEALEYARRYFSISTDARTFVDKYIVQIICLSERYRRIPMHQPSSNSKPKSKPKPKTRTATNHHHTPNQTPEPEIKVECMYEKSLTCCLGIISDNLQRMEHHGVKHLVAYLNVRAETMTFPGMELVYNLLRAVECIPTSASYVADDGGDDDADNSDANNDGNDDGRDGSIREMSHQMSQAVMKHIAWLDDASLTKMILNKEGHLRHVLHHLHTIYCHPSSSSTFHPKIFQDYFTFWKKCTLRMITSRSHRVKIFGWDQLSLLITVCEREMCHTTSPPPSTSPPLPLAYVVHHLAEWAIGNRLIELALGKSSSSSRNGNGEVVERSCNLFRFLARMCHYRRLDRLLDDDNDNDDDDDDESKIMEDADVMMQPNGLCCLQASHLLLAWEFCTNTKNVYVLAPMYLMASSILPFLSAHLKELTFPIINTAIIRRIELDDPTLLELHIGSSSKFNPDPNNQEVGAYDPINGTDLIRLGYNIGKNTHLQVHYDDKISSEEIDVVLVSALVSHAIGICDMLCRNARCRGESDERFRLGSSDDEQMIPA
mmetsp:Transcript_2965/g.6590  ORF Transcript_2965/g.6590 Transcript_2965/m.6590 type:complete len:604 (-) Transcript_2965:26-1837(-)